MSYRIRPGRPTVERRCATCGHAFVIERYRVAAGEGIHCSRDCYNAARSKADAAAFWVNVEKLSTGCWEWRGTPTQGCGYARLRVRGRQMRAHRYAYHLAHGDLPAGLQVCHTCDNRVCVNPEHLFAGTALDNNRDMVAKGRARYPGPRTPARGGKMTRARAAEVRRRRLAGERPCALAREFGVSPTLVRLIAQGRVWAEVAP